MEPTMLLINQGAYVHKLAPVAGPHRALGPEVGRGKSFIGPPMAVVLYGPDNPMIDALEPPKATILVALQSREDLDRGHKGSPGNAQGGRAVPEEKIQGPYEPKNTK